MGVCQSGALGAGTLFWETARWERVNELPRRRAVGFQELRIQYERSMGFNVSFILLDSVSCLLNTLEFYDKARALNRQNTAQDAGYWTLKEIKNMPTEKRIKDLMHPLDQYHCIREEGSLQEALRIVRRVIRDGKPLCLLVMGAGSSERDVIKGYVSAGDIVFGVAANFLKGSRMSGPIFWEGQFEVECVEGVKKRVGEIMTTFKGWVRETEMLMEAVFLLNRYGVSFLPVVNQEEVTGIIHLEDILAEITGMVGKSDKAV